MSHIMSKLNRRDRVPALLGIFAVLAICGAASCGGPGAGDPSPEQAVVVTHSTEGVPSVDDQALTATTASPLADPASTIGDGAGGSGGENGGARSAPLWLGQRALPTGDDGLVPPQTTPSELVDRRLVTVDHLPAPPGPEFVSTVGPVQPEVLARSTWQPGCPVEPEQLAYVTVVFWGFDDRAHTGELLVNAEVADDLVWVFRQLHAARFPIEEMRVVSPADLAAPPTGDGNNTAAFVCRPVTGGTSFSQHAYGLAVDINPFHNPYQRGDRVLPELAGHYLDRSLDQPGMIQPGDAVVEAFAAIGWFWGGEWFSLKDYQHFSSSGR